MITNNKAFKIVMYALLVLLCVKNDLPLSVTVLSFRNSFHRTCQSSSIARNRSLSDVASADAISFSSTDAGSLGLLVSSWRIRCSWWN